jgi:hypothetical protein
MGASKIVMGDQYKPDQGNDTLGGPVIFRNNLWFSGAAWPADAVIKEAQPKIGDPKFRKPGGLNIADYIPLNRTLVQDKGIRIDLLPGDFLGLLQGMNPDKDILGNSVPAKPHIGAIAPN